MAMEQPLIDKNSRFYTSYSKKKSYLCTKFIS